MSTTDREVKYIEVCVHAFEFKAIFVSNAFSLLILKAGQAVADIYKKYINVAALSMEE